MTRRLRTGRAAWLYHGQHRAWDRRLGAQIVGLALRIAVYLR